MQRAATTPAAIRSSFCFSVIMIATSSGRIMLRTRAKLLLSDMKPPGPSLKRIAPAQQADEAALGAQEADREGDQHHQHAEAPAVAHQPGGEDADHDRLPVR